MRTPKASASGRGATSTTRPSAVLLEREQTVNDDDLEILAQRLYASEPPEPQQPWENLAETTREHYRKFARNLSITG